MDPLALGLGFGPIAMYLVAIGLLNLRRYPLIVPGWQDTAYLLLAFTGLFIVGPVNLFFPLPAYIRFGPWVWLLLLALLGLMIISINLWMRPRIVVYNVPYSELKPVLSEVALALDPNARWAGECLVLPTIGVQLFLDYAPLLRNARLVAVGRKQDLQSWNRLETALRKALEKTEVGRNWIGLAFLLPGMLLATIAALGMLTSPEQVADSLERLFLR